jgi:serine protease AprX
VQHRDDHGLHIRVLNLSFGTDAVQSDALDPLLHAVEVAWRAGIVVVAAGGNRGDDAAGLDDPARSSHVIAVGADDTNGTTSTGDDSIPEWSSSGDGDRNPDLVAPGKSITSLRDPGSYIDQQYPGGRAGSRFFKGSGTSTSTAVVSGVVALLLQQRPDLTPDQVKTVLTASARRIPGAKGQRQGAGLVNARDASRALPLFADHGASDDTSPTAGSGSLEAARGTSHVTEDGEALVGERDIFGAAWNGAQWAQQSAEGTSWTGGVWNGNRWAGDDWSGESWAGPAWAAAPWTASSWGGNSWSGASWTGNSWSGNSWSGNSWSGNSWSGNSWSFIEGEDQ